MGCNLINGKDIWLLKQIKFYNICLAYYEILVNICSQYTTYTEFSLLAAFLHGSYMIKSKN
jgi:hypothetical protein